MYFGKFRANRISLQTFPWQLFKFMPQRRTYSREKLEQLYNDCNLSWDVCTLYDSIASSGWLEIANINKINGFSFENKLFQVISNLLECTEN